MTSKNAMVDRAEKRTKLTTFHSLVAWALLLVCPIMMSLLLWLDGRSQMPVALRGHSFSIAVPAIVLCLASVGLRWRGSRRWHALLFAGAACASVACTLAFAVAWHARYALPPSSAYAPTGSVLASDAKLVDSKGAPFRFSELKGRPILVIWFQGAWCPYCRKQLSKIQERVSEYRDSVQVVAVTADTPELVAAMTTELQLQFPVVSDLSGSMARQCELMHCVAIAGPDGIVRWAVVSGNWRQDLTERALFQGAYDTR